MENMALTNAQLSWANQLSALLADIPAGVELVVRPGRADVVRAGFEDRVLNACDLHLAPALIEKESLLAVDVDMRVVPISEAI